MHLVCAILCHGLMLCQTSTAGASLVNASAGVAMFRNSGISAGASAAISNHHKLAESHMFTYLLAKKHRTWPAVSLQCFS